MNLTYCRQWFRAKKKPIGIIDQDLARSAHESRQLYTVLAGTPEKPIAFLEINDSYLGAGFLDDQMREYLSFQFHEVEAGRLFLTMATYREFRVDTDTVTCGTTYFFKKEGYVRIEDENFVNDIKTSRELFTDVSGNWDQYPNFGKYDRLFVIERPSPVL